MKRSTYFFIFIFLIFSYPGFSNYNEEAEKYYLTAIKANNTDDESMCSLGLLYEDQKKYGLAEKYYLMAAKYENDDAMFYLGLLYSSQEKYQLAEKYYLMAIKYNNSSAMTSLGVLYHNQKNMN